MYALGKKPAFPLLTNVPYHQSPPDFEGWAVITRFSPNADALVSTYQGEICYRAYKDLLAAVPRKDRESGHDILRRMVSSRW